jgi:cytochrome c biogenesis protein CcmG/thiol:disulfide interchange protein DsbE
MGCVGPMVAPGSGEGGQDLTSGSSGGRWFVIAGLGVAVIFLVLALRPSTEATGAQRQGVAPPFVLENLERGQPHVSLAEFRGRPVVLNFFASWCAPCRREMTRFERAYQHLGARIAFIGVDHQDQRGPALDLLHQTRLTYPTAFDPQGDVATAYGLRGMPTTILISPEGDIRDLHTGEMAEDVLEGKIRRLLLP